MITLTQQEIQAVLQVNTGLLRASIDQIVAGQNNFNTLNTINTLLDRVQQVLNITIAQ